GQAQGSGQGQGSGAGGGIGGTGTGGGVHEAGKPSDRVYVPGNGSAPGAQALPPGPLGPGRQVPQTGYQSVLGSYSRAELNALNQTVLPPSERELVQQYFAGLAGAGP
ncbi:MAG TPA: hypothetical protein VKL22_06525, partial [Actinomycetota bacterium]|nr:hypothetical protein [Actinomycetota bacterium]